MWAIISLTRTKVKEFLYSIRWKILIAYLLIISIAFSVVAATLIQLVGDYMFNQRVRDDQRVAENLSSIMGEALFSLDVSAMLTSAADASSEGLSRVLVLDRYGVVQVDAYSLLNGRRFENAEVANVLAGGGEDYGFYDAEDTGANVEPGSLTSLTGVRAMTGLYAAPIYYDAELIGVLVYISQAQEIYENLSSLRSQMLLWMLLVAASALIISMFVVRTITRPIGELSAGISRMSRGDLSSRVEVRGKNEFAQLASAFNSMSERLEKLDMSRNQFVSNASHELKTPLSTMKILLETLLYQESYDPAMQKEFLTDINKEIDRLNRIVSDLLTLVNIDSGGMRLNVADVRLRDIVTEQVKRLSPLARERGIELSCLVRDPCETVGDSLKTPAGVLQRHRQRHQIHAARRRGARGTCPRRQARRGARGGHGHRHPGGRSAPYLRPLLPRGQGAFARDGRHGPRPFHRAPDRASPRWRHTRRERGKQGHHVHHRTSHRHEITAASRRP